MNTNKKLVLEDISFKDLLSPNKDMKSSIIRKLYDGHLDHYIAVARRNGIPSKPVTNVEQINALIECHLYGPDSPPFVTFEGQYWPRIGVYSPRKDGKTRFLCLDLDGAFPGQKENGGGHKFPLKNLYGTAEKIIERAQNIGLVICPEISKSGYGLHLWIFFDNLISSKFARELGFYLVDVNSELLWGGLADPHSNKGIEIFPKSEIVKANGFGNLIWLPWYFDRNGGSNEFINI